MIWIFKIVKYVYLSLYPLTLPKWKAISVEGGIYGHYGLRVFSLLEADVS